MHNCLHVVDNSVTFQHSNEPENGFGVDVGVGSSGDGKGWQSWQYGGCGSTDIDGGSEGGGGSGSDGVLKVMVMVG